MDLLSEHMVAVVWRYKWAHEYKKYDYYHYSQTAKDNVRCTAAGEQLGQLKAKEIQLS